MSDADVNLKPVDAPVYSIWTALYHSFYSRRLYVDVGKRWRGLGFIYLLVALLILCIPFALKVGYVFSQDFNQKILEPLLKLPVLYVQNGKISIDEPMPYIIKNNRGQVVLVVDTTGKINDFGYEYPYLNILINQNKISYRIPNFQLYDTGIPAQSTATPVVQPLGTSVNTVFNGKQFADEQMVRGLKIASQLMIYPVVVVAIGSFLIIMYPVFALLGQAFSSILFSFKIGFLQSLRLLIVSSTPMLLVLMILLSLNVAFAGMGIILMTILTSYYCFALYSLRAESQQLVLK